MSEIKLSLNLREETGKNKVDKLRAEQIIPGVIYSKGNEARKISAAQKDIVKVYEEAGSSNLVSITLNGKEEKALFKEVQKHPFKNQILHFDLYLIDMSEKIRVYIPVVLENRDDIKVQPSILMQQLDEIEIECLPGNLPSEAVVDVQDMQIGDTLTVSDLDVAKDEKIEILTDLEETVAILQEPREEISEDEEETVETAEVPTVSETTEEE